MKKKLLWLLLILSLLPSYINAEEWSKEIPLGKVNILQSEVRHKWFKIIKENERYESTKHNCEYFDTDDFIYTNYSEWSSEKPNDIDDRIIEQKSEQKVFNDGKFNKIILNSFYTNELTIKRIRIKKSIVGNYLKYNADKCINCFGDINSINDDKYETHIIVNKDSSIEISFDEDISYSDISVFLEFNKEGYIMSWDTIFLMDDYEIKKIKTHTSTIPRSCYSPYCGYYSNRTPNNIEEKIYNETYYRYKDKQIKWFDLRKEYDANYHFYLEGYEKDENTKATFYKYEILKENECPLCEKSTIIFKKMENKVDKELNKDEVIGSINDENEKNEDALAINYGIKKENKKINLIPFYIVLLGLILILLVLICRKIRLNLKECR